MKSLFLRFFFPHTRYFWFLLLIGFFFYEGCGLYFQYVLHLNPCIECVYERAIFAAYAIAAIIGIIHCKAIFTRLLASGVWLGFSIWGLIISIEHRGFELSYGDPFAATCALIPNFPSWLKLDELLPAVFSPTGVCGDASWVFAGLTMVQWIEVIYTCNLVVAAIFVILSFIPQRKYNEWIGK